MAGLKAAGKALLNPPPSKFSAGGKAISCLHCGHDQFERRKASLNTATSSMTGTDWMDKEAVALVCEHCSEIRWFYDEPRELGR